jgi:hypothetical protein
MMNRKPFASSLVVAALLCGWPITPRARAQTRPRQSAEDVERARDEAKIEAQARREHPEWSDQQIRDYVHGYMSVMAISPEAYDKARSALDAARSLRCSFPHGGYVDLADPKLARTESAGVDVTFDAIDRKAGHARIIAKSGARDVVVTTGPTALTFIEIAATGNPLITVVFPRFRAGTREFYAADSEHIFAFGDISIGQYYGTCTILE